MDLGREEPRIAPPPFGGPGSKLVHRRSGVEPVYGVKSMTAAL